MKLAEPPHDISACRAAARAARRAVPERERAAADAAICRAVIGLVSDASALRVSSYLATDGEVDLAAFHDWAAGNGVELWLPAVARAGAMEFRLHGADGPLVEGPLGTRHPPPSTSSCDAGQLDLMIVPLVAFDENCNRVGRGGGYYDRALAPLVDRPAPFSAGVAFEVQRVSGLAPEPHDVALDRVLTEVREYRRR